MLLLQMISCSDCWWELFFMLLGAFILGFLIGWLLWTLLRGGAYKNRISGLEGDVSKLRTEVNGLEENKRTLEYEKSKAETDLNGFRGKYGDLELDLKATRESKLGLETEVAGLKTKLSALSGAAAGAAAGFAGFKPDDLKLVEGIGPKIEGLLKGAGVKTWSDLGNAAYDRLRKILDDAGPRYRIHDPKTWPRQALLATEGKWEELKEYQDFLSGGKE